MTLDQQIIIKRTANYPGMFRNLQKYAAYINHLLADQTDQGFYLEILPDGLLYIFKNMQILRIMNQPITPHHINRLRGEMNKKISPLDLLKGVINKKTFPAEGITNVFKIIQGPVEEIMEYMIEFFESMSDNDILVFSDNCDKLYITFQTFDALKRNTQRISALVSGLAKEFKLEGEMKKEIDV